MDDGQDEHNIFFCAKKRVIDKKNKGLKLQEEVGRGEEKL
jgi:hypothetical protein